MSFSTRHASERPNTRRSSIYRPVNSGIRQAAAGQLLDTVTKESDSPVTGNETSRGRLSDAWDWVVTVGNTPLTIPDWLAFWRDDSDTNICTGV